jgi:hypothetical protein
VRESTLVVLLGWVGILAEQAFALYNGSSAHSAVCRECSMRAILNIGEDETFYLRARLRFDAGSPRVERLYAALRSGNREQWRVSGEYCWQPQCHRLNPGRPQAAGCAGALGIDRRGEQRDRDHHKAGQVRRYDDPGQPVGFEIGATSGESTVWHLD